MSPLCVSRHHATIHSPSPTISLAMWLVWECYFHCANESQSKSWSGGEGEERGWGQSCRPESPTVAAPGKLETPIGPHEVDEGWAMVESLRTGWPPAVT